MPLSMVVWYEWCLTVDPNPPLYTLLPRPLSGVAIPWVLWGGTKYLLEVWNGVARLITPIYSDA